MQEWVTKLVQKLWPFLQKVAQDAAIAQLPGIKPLEGWFLWLLTSQHARVRTQNARSGQGGDSGLACLCTNSPQLLMTLCTLMLCLKDEGS